MIEHVIMDYEGEPVYFDNGQLYEAEPPRSEYYEEFYETRYQVWNPDTLEFEEDEETLLDVRDRCDNDRKAYGLGWYDCNTDWRSW